MPTYLDLKQQIEKESMLNTPPVFSVFVSMLNLRNLIANGGVPEMEKEIVQKRNYCTMKLIQIRHLEVQ